MTKALGRQNTLILRLRHSRHAVRTIRLESLPLLALGSELDLLVLCSLLEFDSLLLSLGSRDLYGDRDDIVV